MSYNFPEGAKFQFSKTFAAAVTLTDMSSANPCVATANAHGYANLDAFLLTSGWEEATSTVFQASGVTANTFNVDGLDTTDPSMYSADGGDGSTAQKISNWLDIPQVLTIDTQGGDPRFTAVNPLSRRNGINIPTGFNPTSIVLTLGHDPASSVWAQMLAVSRARKQVAFRMWLADGSKSYGYGYLSCSEVAKLGSGQVNQVTASFSLQGRAMTYVQ